MDWLADGKTDGIADKMHEGAMDGPGRGYKRKVPADGIADGTAERCGGRLHIHRTYMLSFSKNGMMNLAS